LTKAGHESGLPRGWKWWAANEIMDIRDGTHDSPKYQATGIPLVTSKNLVNGTIDFSTCQNIAESDHLEISKRSSVDDGDILYAMIGTIGNPVVVEKSFEFSIKNVALFKFNGSEVNNRFFYHFLNTDIVKRQFSANSRGGTQKFVSLGNIRDLRVPLPPLEEQIRIAAILDKADAIRRKRQQAIELADQFLKSVFLDMFGDPVTNPKGWPVKKLSSLSELINGDRSGNYPSGDEILDDGVVFLNTQNIRNDELTLKKLAFISEEKFESLGRGKLARNDIVITLRGTLGSCCIFDCAYETGFINAQMMIIRPNKGLDSNYLHSFLKFPSMKSHMRSIGSGSAVPQLTGKQIQSLEIMIPSDELCAEFHQIERLVKQKLLTQYAKTEDMKLFESLSSKLFNGELTGTGAA